MKHIFITYGDSGFEIAKKKILKQAELTGEFDEIKGYGPEDLSDKLIQSELIKIKKGGGLWSWKPDVIYKTINDADDGDIIVYCDAGCLLQPTKEWRKYWRKLEKHDIIAQRIFKRTDKWTRIEVLDYFKRNGFFWKKNFQYQATILIKVSAFSRKFVSEWRELVLTHPVFIMDVTKEEMPRQHSSLVENRHDQSIYSALIYKYLYNKDTQSKIYAQWEHIEDLDPFYPQAIRAIRARNGEDEADSVRRKRLFKRLMKDFVFKPLYFAPMEILLSFLNNTFSKFSCNK